MHHEWLERIEAATDIALAHRAFDQFSLSYGFGAHSYVDLRRVPDRDEPLPYFISTVRDDFVSDYNGARFLSFDPVVRRALTSTQPFTWYDCFEFQEARNYKRGRKNHARRVLELAYDYGFEDGCILPAHSIDANNNRISSFVSLYWSEKPSEGFRASDLPIELQLGAQLYHRKVTGFRSLPQAETVQPVMLSDREQECLLWAARGKSAAETANIIGITTHSTDSYMKSAMTKLRVFNKTHAVAEAMMRGLIAP